MELPRSHLFSRRQLLLEGVNKKMVEKKGGRATTLLKFYLQTLIDFIMINFSEAFFQFYLRELLHLQ